mmetsp:Transcript_63808/g.179622  ORF Transcript_63808/g.179622 Transcript_63808/m.179622 type:complete len:234 (-) Transcript_63808:37-738(-)
MPAVTAQHRAINPLLVDGESTGADVVVVALSPNIAVLKASSSQYNFNTSASARAARSSADARALRSSSRLFASWGQSSLLVFGIAGSPASTLSAAPLPTGARRAARSSRRSRRTSASSCAVRFSARSARASSAATSPLPAGAKPTTNADSGVGAGEGSMATGLSGDADGVSLPNWLSTGSGSGSSRAPRSAISLAVSAASSDEAVAGLDSCGSAELVAAAIASCCAAPPTPRA